MHKHKENIRREDPKEDLEQQALDRLLDRVTADAEKQPAKFLEETIVPEGGE